MKNKPTIIKLSTFCFFLMFCAVANTQTLSIEIEKDRFGIDQNKKIIVAQFFEIEQYADLSNYQAIEITFETNVFNFKNLTSKFEYSSSYILENGSSDFRLFFTQFPLVFMNTTQPIVDDPKRAVDFVYADENEILYQKPGVEIRGGFSQTFPKKTYDLEFWKDGNADEKIDVQFRDLRNDDDWVLDALYNEPLRIRTHIAHKLWLEMHEIYYANEEPKAKSGADVFFVEMFLNNRYNGLYVISEQIDRKQLKLQKYDNEIRGELYKGITWVGGAVTYTGLPQVDNSSRFWGGYEAKYPGEDDATDWTNIYDLTDFVMNASDTDFKEKIWSMIHQENFLDYFLYLNLIRASDNTGKNLFMAKRDIGEPFFCSPWDLDACFGTAWTGQNQTRTDNILSNGLYDRLILLNPDDFNEKLNVRWRELRSSSWSNEALINKIVETYQYLEDNNIYERESIVYPNYRFNQIAKNYIVNWTEDRVAFLDQYFGELSDSNEITNTTPFVFYPNPTNGVLHYENVDLFRGQEFTISDAIGTSHHSGILDENKIDISYLPSGLYFLKIDNKIFRVLKM